MIELLEGRYVCEQAIQSDGDHRFIHIASIRTNEDSDEGKRSEPYRIWGKGEAHCQEHPEVPASGANSCSAPKPWLNLRWTWGAALICQQCSSSVRIVTQLDGRVMPKWSAKQPLQRQGCFVGCGMIGVRTLFSAQRSSFPKRDKRGRAAANRHGKPKGNHRRFYPKVFPTESVGGWFLARALLAGRITIRQFGNWTYERSMKQDEAMKQEGAGSVGRQDTQYCRQCTFEILRPRNKLGDCIAWKSVPHIQPGLPAHW